MQKDLRHFRRMTNVFQSLWLVIAGATQKELARQVKYLKVENEILGSKLLKRIVVTPKERQRLIRFARKLGKAIHLLTTIVAPKTLLGWMRAENRNPRTISTKRGRRRTPEQIRRLILKLAKETNRVIRAFSVSCESSAFARSRATP